MPSYQTAPEIQAVGSSHDLSRPMIGDVPIDQAAIDRGSLSIDLKSIRRPVTMNSQSRPDDPLTPPQCDFSQTVNRASSHRRSPSQG